MEKKNIQTYVQEEKLLLLLKGVRVIYVDIEDIQRAKPILSVLYKGSAKGG